LYAFHAGGRAAPNATVTTSAASGDPIADQLHGRCGRDERELIALALRTFIYARR
jgi:hypothetical protein